MRTKVLFALIILIFTTKYSHAGLLRDIFSEDSIDKLEDMVSYGDLKQTLQDMIPGKDFVKDEIVIRFKDEVSEERINEILDSLNLEEIRYAEDSKIYLVKNTDNTSIAEKIYKIVSLSEVVKSEPNYISENNQDIQQTPAIGNLGFIILCVFLIILSCRRLSLLF